MRTSFPYRAYVSGARAGLEGGEWITHLLNSNWERSSESYVFVAGKRTKRKRRKIGRVGWGPLDGGPMVGRKRVWLLFEKIASYER